VKRIGRRIKTNLLFDVLYLKFLAELVKKDNLDLICVPTSLQVRVKNIDVKSI
jgi:hypothetical protein